MAILNHFLSYHSSISIHVMQELQSSKLQKNGDISSSWTMESVVDVCIVLGVAVLNIVVKDVLNSGVTSF